LSLFITLLSAVSASLRNRCGLSASKNYIDQLRLAKRQIRRHHVSGGLSLSTCNPGRRGRESGRAVWLKQKGDAMVRSGILLIVMVALAACSDSTPPPPSDPTASAAILKKDCSDPKWREENLGLWYSVCRQSLQW
jgi:hypothetical protein